MFKDPDGGCVSPWRNYNAQSTENEAAETGSGENTDLQKQAGLGTSGTHSGQELAAWALELSLITTE